MDATQMALIHIVSWSVGLILFFVAYTMIKQGKAEKPIKITQMVLRVFYLLIIATGADLFFNHYGMNVEDTQFSEYIIKMVAGIWVIAAIEMTLAKAKKGKKEFSGWLQLVVALILVLVLGFARLPFGFLP
ncbi:putative membrane protein SirB2 [Alkalibacillus flavidus]|uniref:UPF0344 protein ABID56_001497 n=1 Tax=Alkalibacillus flavidus TaxID=546021 RepID=A0ABV2KWC4_9BACI